VVGTLKLLRIVQFAMLGSILLYVAVGELAGPRAGAVNPALTYLLTTAGVAIVGMIFIVRRTLVFRSVESLASNPDDSLSLNHWKTGYLATYALCEALALFGLVLRFTGSSLQQSLPFYLGGLILLAFFVPRQPVAP
jgi:F0F1-type ATP synthase membrane subunit c/vacuolar-type H+-ATPase subunit K